MLKLKFKVLRWLLASLINSGWYVEVLHMYWKEHRKTYYNDGIEGTQWYINNAIKKAADNEIMSSKI